MCANPHRHITMLPPRYCDDDRVEVGIDECGRGCLYGPVCAGAVIWNMGALSSNARTSPLLKDIKDSKKLSAKKRAKVSTFIKENAVAWAVAMVDAPRIDEINILQATFEAMHMALDLIATEHEFHRILVDGTQFKKYKNTEHVTIVQGDGHVLSIAAASIMAKEARDSWVHSQCQMDPTLEQRYRLSSNMGYGTKQHIAGIKEYGITVDHRVSFAPCKL